MDALPHGFGLVLDRSLRRFRNGTVLAGGHPGRVVTLTPAGAAALDGLLSTGQSDAATAELAGRLVRAGMAHPRPATPNGAGGEPGGGRAVPSVTVVVPVLDRPDALDRCLASLGDRHAVVVVDDASRDPAPVAAVCATRGARLVRRDRNGGPGAARNDALGTIDTELVAFVDSDCTTGNGWLDGLTWLFDDPGIGAVAPRVVAAPRAGGPSRRAIDRFDAAHSPLDLGPDGGEVGPDRSVRYVPTAALVVRREALAAVGGFAPGLRVGEDVDLVWRLADAGWRVRYEPSVTVCHTEPERWRGLLARRFRYGTSAGPSRHGTVDGWHRWSCARGRPPPRWPRSPGGPGRQPPRWPCPPSCSPVPSGPTGSRPGRPGRGASRARAGRWSGSVGRPPCWPPRAWPSWPRGAGAGPGPPSCWSPSPRSWSGCGGGPTWTCRGGWRPRWPTTWPTAPGCGQDACGPARSGPSCRPAGDAAGNP